MGSELSEIGVKFRKGLIFTIRCCVRSVCNHPFLVGFLCFLILLYRSSHFVFSLLVSASPILVCTAVLLGVLLSYGETNIPEIEIEETKGNFERNGSCSVETFGEERAEGSDDTALLIEERSREIEPNGGGIWEEGGGGSRELSDLKLKTEWIDEKLKDEVLESDGEKSEAESFDSEKVNVDSLDSHPSSPWARIEEGGEDEHAEEEEDERAEEEKDEQAEEEDSGSDFGSDRAESSSPDASMADIMPMLDELHPLLDEEMIPPLSVRGSRSVSDVASERSSESSTESHESSDESEENHGGLEDDQNDGDNEDGEDDVQGDKEEPSKSAIRWTEEDQKNLMDLGNSEIERNQRLENLIMRRRAKKYMSMAPERNLIDLESTDYPFGLAPISTRRKNPFDDSYGDNLGLPPIPGSAPSVMLQRRNPFDIPYDSSEEKPDLMGDGFKEEFATSQSKGTAVFRRRESFNVGPSIFAPDGKGARMRPYFVPEGMISEESSYSSLFLRQSSELSESKVSSVPETGSTGSVQDLDDRKLLDEDNQQEIEPSLHPDEAFEGPSGGPQLRYHHEEEEKEEDVNGAPELISEIENVPKLVGHGSQSSEDEESLGSGRDELEIQLEDATETYHPDYEGGEGVYRRNSSSSSLSEESEGVFTEIESARLSVLEERRDVDILTQTSAESPNLSLSSALSIDIPHRTPVYDSSPRPNEINILPETSITHSLYVVDPREHGIVNVDFSEVGKETEIETSEVSISLKLSGETSVVEEHGLDKISGARDDEKIHNLDKSSEEQFEVSEPLFEGRDIQLEEERETVRSPDSDDGAYQRTDEKNLISTASVEGNAYPFHDADEIREPNFQHLDEVMASSPLIELEWSKDAQITQNSNMPEVQELEHNIPSNINSPSSATETTKSHFTVQTATVEQEDNIKEIDVDLLAELDNVGDFSVQQWGPSSTGFEKHDSVEDNEIEGVVHSEKSRDDIDIHEEGMECEPQISEGSGPEHIEVSRTEFDERDGLDSPNSKTSEKIEVQADEKIDSFPDEDKSIASGENEITYRETAYGMPELEAGKIEDIDVAFKEITAKEMIFDFEPVVKEEQGNSSVVGSTHVVSVPEVELIEKDATLDSKQSLSDSVDHPLHVIEPEETQETFSEQASREHETLSEENEARIVNYVGSQNYEGNLSETPEIEVQPDEKTESFSDKDELAENEVTHQGEADNEMTYRMTDLEASKVEDIDLAFKEITAKETTVKTTLVEDSKNESSSVAGTTLESSVIEVVPFVKETTVEETLAEDSKNKSSSVARFTPESSVLEVVPVEKDASLDPKQSLSDSVDQALHLIESEETKGISSSLAGAGTSVSSEETTLPPIDKVLELLKPNSDDESVEVKVDEVGPSVVESRVQEISMAAEKPDSEVEIPKDSHSILSDERKGSKSSSSSSSSSSDSSSSDSDKD